MRYRIGLSLAVLVAAGCSAGVDSPVAIQGPSFEVEGVKPPPPLGSGDVDIQIFSPSSETELISEFSVGGPSAESFDKATFSETFHGRYFSNSQHTNGWIQFDSEGCRIASPDAKLQFNEKTGKTQGHGTLTSCDGVTIDLSKIEITGGGFGNCVPNSWDDKFTCDDFSFKYDGVIGGSVFLGSSD